MKKKLISTQCLAVLMILVMVFSLIPSVSLAGERPFGQNPQDQANYYIAVNDAYVHPNGKSSGNLYGWGITGAAVVTHEKIITGTGDYPDRSFDIELASDTPRDTTLYILCDLDYSGSGYSVPIINKNPGKSAQARNIEWNAIKNTAKWDTTLNAGSFKVAVQLEEGSATLPLYVYKYLGDDNGATTVHTFNFTIAPPDTASDPDPEDVASIAITTPPTKTTYFSGGRFDTSGMVVMASLKGGGDPVPVTGYTVFPSDALSLSDTEVSITFGEHMATQNINVLPSTSMGKVEIINGQLMGDIKELGFGQYEKKVRVYDAVTLYGEPKGLFKVQVGEGAEIYIGDDKQAVTAEGQCTLALDTSVNGTSTVITVKGDRTSTDYTFTCYAQAKSGMPSKVVEYLCIASQYTNGSSYGSYGLNAVSTLRGVNTNSATGNIDTGPTSLGNFGGYITYYFKDPIFDDPRNKFGIDFIVYGNSHNGNDGFAEPGNVLVSSDGENWYTLAGSLHYEDNAIWDYEMTYTNTGSGCSWTDNRGGSGTAYKYPAQLNYPLFPWTEQQKSQITLTGTRLLPQSGTNEYGNTLPPFPHFGYADVGVKDGEIKELNPYAGVVVKDGNVYTVNNRPDVMDLKWAVDEDGYPVTFNKGIHYVKIQTASFIQNSAIGEKSTEVHMVISSRALPDDPAVGVTNAVSGIKVDGQAIALQEGVSQYNAKVNGMFEVMVAGTESANVYINGERGTSRAFGKLPDHGIIRIIVQEGDKAAQIYYLTLSERDGGGEIKPSSAITFNANYGKVNGQDSVILYYDADTTNKMFPIPVYHDRTFLGWFSGETKYTEYTSGMPSEITLTAKWEYNVPGGKDPKEGIKVKFRLIGATRSNGDISLRNGDYKGSEYVTWIATRKYNMAWGSTVYDLFVMALDEAELESKGAEKNYVEMIKAPGSLNGYRLSEFTNGEYSGWMYTINGSHPGRGLREKDLQDGDSVVWHYVNDYRYEVADWFDDPEYPALGDGTYWNEWLKAKDVEPSEELVGSGKDKSTALTPKITAIRGVASVIVSVSDISSAIDNAKSNSSTSIVIAPEIAGTVKKVSVELPKASLKSISSDADVDLTVKTPVGSVTIPHGALASVVSQAAGNSVIISIESIEKEKALSADQKTAIGDHSVYDLSILSGDSNIITFSGGKLKISLPYTLKSGEDEKGVLVWHLNDKGQLEKMNCTYSKASGLAVFATDHLSYYAVGWSPSWQNPYTDVKDTDWFCGAVEFAARRGLFNGTTDTSFSPNAQMTRAMLATVLYRLEGSPQVTGKTRFNDVEVDKWYSDAILWADSHRITVGIGGGMFGLNNNVTREQLAAILYNYATYKGYDIAIHAGFGNFTDASEVSSWAQEEIKWANGEGLVTGRTTALLKPRESALRAEVATILQRFYEEFTK